jgi:hypothetical protein
VADDAPARCRQKAQPNTRALAATPQTTRPTPLAAAEPYSYLPIHGLPGIEPKQPNPLKETASSAGPPAPARGRCYPRASPPPQHIHRLQESEATGAISPSFPISAALAHQHHAQPRRDRNEFPRLRDPLKRDCNQKLDLLGV